MSNQYPPSLNAVDVVCFAIDWEEKALKVLLLKRDVTPQKGKWALPGGFVNEDETIEEAAIRKMVDETGIKPNYMNQLRTYSDIKRDTRKQNENDEQSVRVVTTAFTAVFMNPLEPIDTMHSSEIKWFKIPRRYVSKYIPPLAFDHSKILEDAANKIRVDLEYSGLAVRFLQEWFTLGQIQEVYEIIWEVELDPANFRDKITNIDGWIKETKPPEGDEPRRGKPPTWYKEHDIPQFERMITNPNGAVLREKESEYQKNLDEMTTEIPVISIEEGK